MEVLQEIFTFPFVSNLLIIENVRLYRRLYTKLPPSLLRKGFAGFSGIG